MKTRIRPRDTTDGWVSVVGRFQLREYCARSVMVGEVTGVLCPRLQRFPRRTARVWNESNGSRAPLSNAICPSRPPGAGAFDKHDLRGENLPVPSPPFRTLRVPLTKLRVILGRIFSRPHHQPPPSLPGRSSAPSIIPRLSPLPDGQPFVLTRPSQSDDTPGIWSDPASRGVFLFSPHPSPAPRSCGPAFPRSLSARTMSLRSPRRFPSRVPMNAACKLRRALPLAQLRVGTPMAHSVGSKWPWQATRSFPCQCSANEGMAANPCDSPRCPPKSP